MKRASLPPKKPASQSTIGDLFSKQKKKKIDIELEHEKFSIVPMYPDGRCFFTSVVSGLFSELSSADRSSRGLVIAENLMSIEHQKADCLRKHVVDLLWNETEKLSDLARDLPFILDSRVNKHYSSIADRLADMSKVDTYAGNLEILATGYLLRMQVHTYQKAGTGFRLMAKLPNDFFQKRSIALIYEQDETSTPGHFNLMMKHNNSGDLSTRFSVDTTVDEVIASLQQECNNDSLQHAHIQFCDLFAQYSAGL